MMNKSDLAIFGGAKVVTENGPPWPCFSDEEIQAVQQCMLKSRKDWRYACTACGGAVAEDLEKRFAKELGRQYAVSTAGGGPALHIACMAAGIGLGDEVITVPYSWGQTVSCILQCGGIPIFADIHPKTLTLDPAKIEPLITPWTKAIVLVNIFGIPADMDPIMEIARRHKLIVIEDCAQSQGSRYKGKPVGTRSDIACFSIGSGKNLAAGDGGVLVTDDRRLYELSLLAGMHPGRTGREIETPELKEWVDSFIYTYRIHAFTAALALKQMDRIEEMNEWRRRNAGRLAKGLESVPGIKPLDLPAHLDPAWHMVPWNFVPEELPGVSREQYLKALTAEGVPIFGSYVHLPLNLRKTFQEKHWWLGKGYPWAASARADKIVYRKGDCPVAEKRSAELDLTMGGSGWYKDVSALLDQIVAAFKKVTAKPEWLREIPL